jgi:thiamine-monophosphate kinase
VLPAAAATLAASTDVSVEGVHFDRAWLSFEEIGWRAAAAALSDLAADGAEAAGVLVALTVPSEASDDDVASVMTGAGAVAAEVGARIVGGDLSSGPVWSLAVTVLGWAAAPITRAGAVAGDGVWVTGALGGARAALEAWQRGVKPDAEARRRFARPVPRLRGGLWLARHGAHAMLDVSDGLGADASHLAAASGVAVALDLERVPMAASVPAAAGLAGVTSQQFAAESGEDYELLVALPATFAAEDALNFQSDVGLPLTRVGEVRPGAGVDATLDGKRVALDGFDHFAPRRR